MMMMLSYLFGNALNGNALKKLKEILGEDDLSPLHSAPVKTPEPPAAARSAANPTPAPAVDELDSAILLNYQP